MLPIVLAAIILLILILITGYFSRNKKDKSDVNRNVNVDADYIDKFVSRLTTNSKKKKE